MEDTLRELEEKKDIIGLLDLLLKYEREHPLIYAKWHEIMFDINPRVASLLLALEEISNVQNSLLKQALSMVTQQVETDYAPVIAAKGTAQAGDDDWKPPSITEKTRDNIFTLSSLESYIKELPPKDESTLSDEKVELVFWYIKEGKNESLKLEIPTNQYFAVALYEVMKKANLDDAIGSFSISPLGFEPLLVEQLKLTAKQIVDQYDYELTLIWMHK